MSLPSVKALAYFSFSLSASLSSICNDAKSFVILELPNGITDSFLSILRWKMLTVVVSAPRSTRAQPPLFSASVRTLSASANGEIYMSSMLMLAWSKHFFNLL